jgi:hypothetical protein
MSNAEQWQTRTPDLVADVRLYPTAEGGRRSPAPPGWGCPCFATKGDPEGGWDARLQLGGEPFHPGTERRVGFVFLYPEGAARMRSSGTFYLWEAGYIGEARVVQG